VLLELVFIREGCFTFNNSTYFTTSDVTSYLRHMNEVNGGDNVLCSFNVCLSGCAQWNGQSDQFKTGVKS